MSWKDIGSNIIKLAGYGVYVTYIDSDLYVCPMVGKMGHPRLDEDKCIDWEKLSEPANQEFLNLCNLRFKTCYTMNDFDGIMSITDIKSHVKVQKRIKNGTGPDFGNFKDPD